MIRKFWNTMGFTPSIWLPYSYCLANWFISMAPKSFLFLFSPLNTGISVSSSFLSFGVVWNAVQVSHLPLSWTLSCWITKCMTSNLNNYFISLNSSKNPQESNGVLFSYSYLHYFLYLDVARWHVALFDIWKRNKQPMFCPKVLWFSVK